MYREHYLVVDFKSFKLITDDVQKIPGKYQGVHEEFISFLAYLILHSKKQLACE